MGPLISVIIPVYKVEEYLDRCVSSVVNQTYGNLEIILVDDGSPDGCPEMCDAWAERDSRIKVIHKENGGPGQAKNVGIDAANGEFIGLVDSDDYISEYMYEHLLGLMDGETDIAECKMIYTYVDDETLDDGTSAEVKVFSADEAMLYHIKDRVFRQTPPNKLYRKSTVADIRFREGTRIDDEFWTYRVIGASRKLALSSALMYAYRQQSGSIMQKGFSFYRLEAVEAKCERLEYLKTEYPDLVSQAKTNLWFTCLYLGQMVLKHLDDAERKKGILYLKKTIDAYRLSKNDTSLLSFQYRVWAALSKISFKLTCRVRNVLGLGI